MRVGLKCELGLVTDDQCRACSADPLHPCGIPAPMLSILRGENNPDNDTTTGLSYTPSRLLGCYRQGVLERDHDYYVDVHYQKASLRGTILHAGLDCVGWPNEKVITEKRLSVPIYLGEGQEPVEFTAKPDAIVVVDEAREPNGEVIVTCDIWDWKTREFKAGELLEADVKHRQQVWMYAWIVSKTSQQWYGQEATVHIRSVNIHYVGSSNFRSFSSLGPGKASITRQRPKRVEEIELAAIPTQPMEKVEKFILGRIKQKQRALTVLAPALEGQDAKWCYRCPVAVPCGFWQRQRAAA
jgi:PD-(D/E)XK nuclease superfamily